MKKISTEKAGKRPKTNKRNFPSQILRHAAGLSREEILGTQPLDKDVPERISRTYLSSESLETSE